MARAVVDPAELRRFARDLKRFNTDIRDEMAGLTGRFTVLGETWQDQEHEAFANEFQEAMKVLRKFIETSDRHIPFLLRKAERIEDYLNQH